MPLPWLFNQWACNPFAAEPDREATLALEAVGIGFATRPEDIVATPLPPWRRGELSARGLVRQPDGRLADRGQRRSRAPSRCSRAIRRACSTFVTATEGQAPEKL